jgi:hypothetical protein
VREIPNKPPPPYTPPGEEKKTEQVDRDLVPKTQQDVLSVVRCATDLLYRAVVEERDLSTVAAPHSPHDTPTVKCYKQFLFDLTRQLVSDIYCHDECDERAAPWEQTTQHSVWRKRLKRIPRTLSMLNSVVDDRVLVLFGFKQKVARENLIIRWSRKKRDHVDELLVRESQEEEAEWTDYDRDQVTVKNDVTGAILDNLLTETAILFDNIFKKKKLKTV